MKLKSYTAKTHQGPYLHINEDEVDVDLRNKIYMLIDGFGGSGIGDRVAKEVKETVKRFYTRVGGDPDSTLPFFFSHKYLIEGNALINSMHYAHSLIKKDNRQKEMDKRGGASALCLAQAENVLTVVSTGNMKAYLYRKGHFSLLIKPDNLELFGSDDYRNHFTTIPMSGFGLFDDLHLKVEELKIQEGDIILGLTDGVYGRIKDEEIKYVLDLRDRPHLEKVNELFEMANSRGNLDNQSALILQF